MLYYISIIFILFIFSFNYEVQKSKDKKIYRKVILSCIIFFLAFNYKMGTDWIAYQSFYENIVPKLELKKVFLGYYNEFEIGYILLNIIFYKLGFNYEIFMATLLTICIYSLLNQLIIKSDNVYLAIFIFLTNFLFTATLEPIIRQLISMTIVVNGFKFIERRQFYKYCIYVFLAAQFHITAYILILIYFLQRKEIKIKEIFFTLPIICLTLNYFSKLVLYLGNIFPIFSKYLIYLERPRYTIGLEKDFFIESIKILLIIICLFVIEKKYKFFIKKENYIKNTAIIYIIIFYFTKDIPILHRLISYFILNFSVALSNLGDKNIKKIAFLIFFYIIFSGTFIKVISGSELNRYRYLNYKNYIIEYLKGKTEKDFKIKKEIYEKVTRKMIHGF